MIGALVWGGRKLGAEISECTDERAERRVMVRIVEAGGRCDLVADGHIGALA